MDSFVLPRIQTLVPHTTCERSARSPDPRMHTELGLHPQSEIGPILTHGTSVSIFPVQREIRTKEMEIDKEASSVRFYYKVASLRIFYVGR